MLMESSQTRAMVQTLVLHACLLVYSAHRRLHFPFSADGRRVHTVAGGLGSLAATLMSRVQRCISNCYCGVSCDGI
eukprot:SAG31_NODE_960_length_10753_cov_7.843064_3_plen_76_part_00